MELCEEDRMAGQQSQIIWTFQYYYLQEHMKELLYVEKRMTKINCLENFGHKKLRL
jgi:hypothetical protein